MIFPFAERNLDERFRLHRLRSSRIALAVAVIAICGWSSWELIVNDNLRWDLLIILGLTALAKVVAMIYYRLTD
jgi:hypothetical protein